MFENSQNTPKYKVGPIYLWTIITKVIEQSVAVFEKKVLRNIFGPEKDRLTGL